MALARGSAIGRHDAEAPAQKLPNAVRSVGELTNLPHRFLPLATSGTLPSHFTLHFTTHIRARRARAFNVRPASFIPSVVRPLARRSRVMSCCMPSCLPCDTRARQSAGANVCGKLSIVKTRCLV